SRCSRGSRLLSSRASPRHAARPSPAAPPPQGALVPRARAPPRHHGDRRCPCRAARARPLVAPPPVSAGVSAASSSHEDHVAAPGGPQPLHLIPTERQLEDNAAVVLDRERHEL